mmetsp:Transcript_27678/g.50116  ORF Transcript_27678/g.50116 Transcript_27678/m.50116 type:complete len:95 (-) Transcript_27678:37-321(-)
MEIEVAGNETSRNNDSVDDNCGSVDTVVDIVVDVHHEVDMSSEALSAAVESDNNGVVGDHDGVGIDDSLSQNDNDMLRTNYAQRTTHAHHFAIC